MLGIGVVVGGLWVSPVAAQLGSPAPTATFVHVDSRAGASASIAYMDGFAGLLEWKANLQSGYREVDGALGYRWGGHNESLVTAVMLAKDAEPLGGIALWPVLSIRRFSVSGQVLMLFPLRSGSRPRYYADPIRAFYSLTACCRAGLYYRGDQFGESPVDQSIGPSFQTAGRGWRLTVDLPLAPTRGRELRATVLTAW